jgi:hypothetical protein
LPPFEPFYAGEACQKRAIFFRSASQPKLIAFFKSPLSAVPLESFHTVSLWLPTYSREEVRGPEELSKSLLRVMQLPASNWPSALGKTGSKIFATYAPSGDALDQQETSALARLVDSWAGDRRLLPQSVICFAVSPGNGSS